MKTTVPCQNLLTQHLFLYVLMRVSKIWVVFWSADSFSHRLMFQGVGERQGQNTLGSESDAELVFVVSFQSEAGVTHWHLCDALSPASVSVSWVMHPPAEVTQWYVVLPRHWGVTAPAPDNNYQVWSLAGGRQRGLHPIVSCWALIGWWQAA